MPVHFETTSATSSSVTSSFRNFRSRWSSASAAFSASSSLLELDERAVAELGGPLEVAVALGALGLHRGPPRSRDFSVADRVDPLLLLLPVRLHRAALLLQVGELPLEALEAVLRGRVRLLLQRGLLDLELADPPLDLVDLDRHRVDLDPQAARGLVDQVDRLVGQEPAGDVAVREHGGRHERRVLDPHPVVHLVALLQPAQDPDRVLDARLLHQHRLEPPLERRVLLDVLAVLVERGRADRAELAAREHRLEHVAGVHRALGRARADDRVQLVDERDDLALAVGDLLQDGLQPLLELAAVLGAGDHRAEVERDQPLVLAATPARRRPRSAARAPRRSRSCPRPGSPISTGLFFVRRESTWIVRRISSSRPITGSSLPGARLLGEVAPVLLERLERVLGVLARDPLTSRAPPRGRRATPSRVSPASASSPAAVVPAASSSARSRCSVETYSSVSASASRAAASSSRARGRRDPDLDALRVHLRHARPAPPSTRGAQLRRGSRPTWCSSGKTTPSGSDEQREQHVLGLDRLVVARGGLLLRLLRAPPATSSSACSRSMWYLTSSKSVLRHAVHRVVARAVRLTA